MTTLTEKQSWPFLSVVAWPEGWTREQVTELLAGPGALDAATLRLRLGREPPMVLERVEPVAAREMIDALVAAGGDGFAFTLADLARPGATLEVRRLGVGEGAFAVELRDGITTSIPFASVQIVVRAHLSETVTTGHGPARPMRVFGIHRVRTWDSIKAEIEASPEKDVRTSDKLELHAADGSVYQVNGDRFGFEVLGERRGHSDKANMDSLTELIAHLCPDAVIDTYFRLFRPPPGAHRLKLPNTRLDRPEATFAFYSRWAAMMYRHVMGASA